LLTLAVVVATAGAASHANADPGQYTGWVEVGGHPAHEVFQGDGPRLWFYTAVGSTSYRACVNGPHLARCWNLKTLSNGLGHNAYVSTGWTGWYTARWWVRGRLVASWKYYVASEGA
jgi:hypothetical protein